MAEPTRAYATTLVDDDEPWTSSGLWIEMSCAWCGDLYPPGSKLNESRRPNRATVTFRCARCRRQVVVVIELHQIAEPRDELNERRR